MPRLIGPPASPAKPPRLSSIEEVHHHGRYDEEGRPIKQAAHEIGQDLSLVSETELDNRIAMLRAEIERIEAEKAKRGATRAAADSFFKLK